MVAPASASLPRAIDLDLVRKYSIAGPRYTSYPPATKFTPDFGPAQLARVLAADNRPGAGPLSLYFHLPFCESLCWYCGCTTVITREHDAAARYLDDLTREVGLLAAHLDRSRPVVQIHFGGGTPTFFPPEQLRRLGALIHDTFRVAPDCEFGVEIDPRHFTAEQCAVLQAIGCNRASLGVQDTDPAVQLAIHRWQPQAANQRSVDLLRSSGVRSINFDLIYGLPCQSEASFARTLDDVLTLGPDRLSVFSYAHVPWLKPSQKIFEHRDQIASPELKLALFGLAHARLTAAGFVDIGLDHFARPGDELAIAQQAGTLHRNFQGYSTRGGASLYAFGLSSVSSAGGAYWQNHKTLDEWRNALAAGRLPLERGLELGADDLRRRTVIMHLMCDRRLDYAALTREIGTDARQYLAADIASLDDLELDGIVQRHAAGLEITPLGAPLLRVVAMRFDPTLESKPRQHAQSV
jgi:oxygen-independent coproporphyrinogen-3 oxidase